MTSASKLRNGKNSSSTRVDKVLEIIELMEEQHKNRDWILQQIKQKGERVPLRTALTTAGVLKNCPTHFLSHIHRVLENGEYAHFMGPPPLTKSYHWFYTDIVDSSIPSVSTNEQAYKIIALNTLTEQTDVFRTRNPSSTIILPTGDGMAIGFDDTPEKPLNLAIQLHKAIKRYNEQMKRKSDRLQVRIGLDTGPVYIIKDLNGHENVWGPGIIMARRIMDLAKSMNILASNRFADYVRTLRPEYRKILHLAGQYPIKHGEKILIHNIYDDNIGNSRSPPQQSHKSAADEEVQQFARRFIFLYAKLELHITDPKSMLTHHTVEWNLLNISQEPILRVFFYTSGDTPRTFPELNMVIKDEEGKELDIMSLNLNAPQKKEFHVKLRKPLQPNEKGRKVRFEWDWEEPKRYYVYTLASACKKFFYRLVTPKSMKDVKQKVLRVDPEIGEKTYASESPKRDNAEITWNAKNLQMFDTYRFEW